MSEDEPGPVSSTDQRDSAITLCEHCETVIDTSDWYPVTKERDSDGSLQFYSFCSEDCQEAWATEHGA